MEDYKLKDDTYFLAVVRGAYGTWAKDKDPLTAIRRANEYCGDRKARAITVWYGKTLECDLFDGHVEWVKADKTVTPIGLFYARNRTIRPLKKDELGYEHLGHEEWMNESIDILAG